MQNPWKGVILPYVKSLERCNFKKNIYSKGLMRRKIYDELLRWKREENGSVALMIDGARRVGKSYIAEEFAKNEYKSHILIDFVHVDDSVKQFFLDYKDDYDSLFTHLSLYFRVKLYDRESLIIFDEVEEFPKAREAIKYLVKDGRYDYLETGSLISINSNVKDIHIPSEERRIKMYPMDFEEYLWATGEDMLMAYIRSQYEKKEALEPSFHRRAMNYFRQYVIVGGMPQAVKRYVDTRDFELTERIKRDIINLYRADIKKYAGGYCNKVLKIFDTIPGQLQKHEKKFTLSSLKEEARFREYENSFKWLEESMVVNVCYGASDPSVGLRLKEQDSTLKLYIADTGLLITLAFDERTIAQDELYRKLMLDKLEINQGMLVENVVAQMLVVSGHNLFFYSSYSKDNSADTMEIDFLIRKPVVTSRHNISPIEVKTGKNYTLTSLNKFRAKYGSKLATAYIVHDGQLRIGENEIYLPYYMVPCL